MAATTALPKIGYPTWLAILAALMGGFAALMGLAMSVALMAGDESSGGWGFLLLTVGATILMALALVHRAPLASILLLIFGGLAFGAVTYWLVAPIFAGLAVATGAALAAPRLLHTQPPA